MSSPENKDTQGSLIATAKERLASITSSISSTVTGQPQLPSFDSLAKVPGQPQGCTWGFWDKNGVKDELGTLNLLTPSVVSTASSEIRTGQHVQLDHCLSNYVEYPGFGRRKFGHRVLDARKATKGAQAGFDDEVHFNTQSGSQWDSLKHYAHQPTQTYYNGLTHDDARPDGKEPHRNGVHKWCERGGIVGRGVLVDWVRWHQHTKPNTPLPSAVSRHEIPISEIEATLTYQNTTLKQGDILLVRSGYSMWHNSATPSERQAGTQQNSLAIGVENNEKSVRWLYDQHFAAVGGDTIAFEAWPPPKTGWALHEWLLVQFGTPIGELWNLEELSQLCEKEGRWSFFLTSAPLHVKGGVGSPPGAIAIL